MIIKWLDDWRSEDISWAATWAIYVLVGGSMLRIVLPMPEWLWILSAVALDIPPFWHIIVRGKTYDRRRS
jgi:hypothetical protein